MRTRTENFFILSFGNMAVAAHIVIANAPICPLGAAADLDYTSVAIVNTNLPLLPKRQCTAPSCHYSKWLLFMYLMVNYSEGVSSEFMVEWLGVAKRTRTQLRRTSNGGVRVSNVNLPSA